MFYLTDETRLDGMSVKRQNGTDRQIDRSPDGKKGLADPTPPLRYGSVVLKGPDSISCTYLFLNKKYMDRLIF
jgi:hypothetical protein